MVGFGTPLGLRPDAIDEHRDSSDSVRSGNVVPVVTDVDHLGDADTELFGQAVERPRVRLFEAVLGPDDLACEHAGQPTALGVGVAVGDQPELVSLAEAPQRGPHFRIQLDRIESHLQVQRNKLGRCLVWCCVAGPFQEHRERALADILEAVRPTTKVLDDLVSHDSQRVGRDCTRIKNVAVDDGAHRRVERLLIDTVKVPQCLVGIKAHGNDWHLAMIAYVAGCGVSDHHGPMSIDETTTSQGELLVQHVSDAEFAKIGRRTFFDYRETGLEAATNGKYRAKVMRATDVMEDTGWHYHECDLQFVYVLKGWVDLEFEGGRVERLAEGAALAIPGGMIHNEIGMSEDYEALEVASPADMGTVAVAAPSA